MNHTYHFTLVSANGKTGPIPVTTSSKSTCPSSCPLKTNGCYAEHGHLRMHWDKVSAGARGGTLDELCGQIRALPRHQLWRWGQAGDLPGDGKRIDAKALQAVVLANRGRCGFGFTHYDPKLVANARAIAAANAGGFTLNLSADNVAEADKLVALGIAPVVVVLPKGTTKHFKTPAGNHVSVCPATVRDDVTCARCGICQNKDRKAIMGFPAHGSGAAKAHVISLTGLTKSLTKSRRTTPFDDGSVETAKRKTA